MSEYLLKEDQMTVEKEIDQPKIKVEISIDSLESEISGHQKGIESNQSQIIFLQNLIDEKEAEIAAIKLIGAKKASELIPEE